MGCPTWMYKSCHGFLCACAQPTGDGVTMYRRLSLGGCIHKRIPGRQSSKPPGAFASDSMSVQLFDLVINICENWSLIINPLRAIFQRGQKHVCTFYVIPAHWYDTGTWNPSSSKIRTYLLYRFNIMTAEVLATKGASASGAMILT